MAKISEQNARSRQPIPDPFVSSEDETPLRSDGHLVLPVQSACLAGSRRARCERVWGWHLCCLNCP